MGKRRGLIGLLAIIIAVNALFVVVRSVFYQPVTIVSDSMSPILESGDRILIAKRTTADEIARGDIIAVDTSVLHGHTFEDIAPSEILGGLVIKRVIGMPGEIIQGAEHVVALNKTEPLTEPWVNWKGDDSSFGPIVLGPDEYWIMGDNRDGSVDSRIFGPVTPADIEGRAVMFYWPPGEIGFIDHGE